MDINKLIQDRGLHITITENPRGYNPPRITDKEGYSSLLWAKWGMRLKMDNGTGYLLYIPDSELAEDKTESSPIHKILDNHFKD